MERVLIIDDDRFVQNVLQKGLYKNFETRTADDGPAGLRLADSWHPDFILLDVEMPGQNGYEVCDSLKHNSNTKDIPVVFLSSCTGVRERMLGFEAGADDFLVKPCSMEVLNAKIQRISDIYKTQKKLKKSVSEAEKTALEAMSSNFEMGRAVRFIEKSYGITTFNKLASAILELVTSFDLSAVLMFNSRTQRKFYSTQGLEVKPIEQDVLTMLHSDKRFMDFGCRTQINYPNLSLLIKNMPLQDRSKYGRYKDVLPFVLNAADMKIRLLETENVLQKQNKQISKTVEGVQSTLAIMARSLETNKHLMSNTMTDLSTDLCVQMSKLGMEQDQEEFVFKRIEQASRRLSLGLAETGEVSVILTGIASLLKTIESDQEQVLRQTLAMANEEEFAAVANDVELF